MKHLIEICPDYDAFYIDERGCSCGYNDDAIENQAESGSPSFRIVVPGISEWHRRFEYATDFAETTTDPSFDWRNWHIEGLLFAKTIYEQLPRNYNLIYRAPFEDKSGLLKEVDFSCDPVDDVIAALGDFHSVSDVKPSFKNNICFEINKIDDSSFCIIFRVGSELFRSKFQKDDIKRLKTWMEWIARDYLESIRSWAMGTTGRYFFFNMVPQSIGQFTSMGQFYIEEGYGEIPFFSYVDRREFVRALYLSLMSFFGFNIYTTEEFRTDNYPQGEERARRWQDYNNLRSDIIEWFITDELYNNMPRPSESGHREVNESIVMFADYGCCFWDTMGVGSGDYDGLFLDCGEFEMEIPGLEQWLKQYEDPQDDYPYDWWQKGWEIAKEVRKRLPPNVDLYYMCFDPRKPGERVSYCSCLPRIIVPYIDSAKTI